MDEAIESLDTANTDGLSFKKVESWNDQPLFIEAISDRVKDALKLFPAEVRDSAPVLFSAHSLPSALMEQGDPYVEELKETCRLVADQLGLPDERWQLCFQSAGAMNGRWLGPDLEDVIEELAEQGHKNMLAAPIGFVSDHVEILYDIDIEACQGAEARGVRLVRTQSMNTHPTFIRGLAEIVLNAIAAEPST
jgi:ferrochelatase